MLIVSIIWVVAYATLAAIAGIHFAKVDSMHFMQTGLENHTINSPEFKRRWNELYWREKDPKDYCVKWSWKFAPKFWFTNAKVDAWHRFKYLLLVCFFAMPVPIAFLYENVGYLAFALIPVIGWIPYIIAFNTTYKKIKDQNNINYEKYKVN